VYSDAGSTAATNGGTIEQWNDQSGNNNHAKQTTSGSRPTYVTGFLNGLPVVFFNNGPWMVMTSAAVCAEYYCVWVSTQPTFVNYVALVDLDSDNASTRMGLFASGTTVFNAPDYPTAVRKDGIDLIDAYNAGGHWDISPIIRPMLLRVRTNSPSTSRLMDIGAWARTGIEGYIAEIIGFSANLSNADRNLVELYLQNKWGTPKLPTMS
jgi:hypothetical protein